MAIDLKYPYTVSFNEGQRQLFQNALAMYLMSPGVQDRLTKQDGIFDGQNRYEDLLELSNMVQDLPKEEASAPGNLHGFNF